MLLDDHAPGDHGPEAFLDDGNDGRFSAFGPLNWRVGLVVGLALLTGAGATLATADLGGNDDVDQASTRVQTEALAPTLEAQTASTTATGEASPELRQDGDSLLPLAVPGDDTTSTTEATASTSDESTSSSDPSSSTTSTTDGDGDDVTTTAAGAATTARSTTTAGDRTATTRRTSTSRGTTSTRAGSSTTRQRTTTSRATSTTRATTTTARPTTTTQPTTTTARPTTTQAGNSCATGAEFELVMRDDFNGSSIGGQWLQWDQNDGNGNNGRRMASALSVANGQLTIAAQMENGTLVSGGMNHTHAQTYGRYRFRVRTDVDPSRTMSGVVLTWPTSTDHLRDGENNAYETLPHQDSPTRSPFYSFIHKPFAQNSGQQEYKIWQADAAQWQTITMEWTPDRISVTRDGGETWTVNETGANLIPDVPHRFHIQLDAFGPSISSRVTMQVDFAEVYRYCS